MSKKIGSLKSLLLFGVAIGGLGRAGAVMSQPVSPTPSSAKPDMQEVIVTASKRTERLHDVAMGITAITGNDLQMRQDLGITDFAAQVPGFNVESTGTPGFNREILRGQNSGSAGATVATVIDDMPLSSSGSQNDDGLVSTNPDTYDLERVEVLKGPQGTLYGAAAEGGVVKFVTNPPDTTAFHGGMEVSGDTVDHGGDGGSVKGYVNIPFWQDKAALRLTGFYEDIPGYINNPYLDQHNINRTDRFGGRASLLMKPSSDLTVRFTVSHQESHDNGFGEEEAVGDALALSTSPSRFNLADGYTFNTLLPQNDVYEIGYYIGDIEYDLRWAKLTSVTSYGKINETFNSDFSETAVARGTAYGAYFGKLEYKTPIAVGDEQLNNVNKFNQEFRINSETGSMMFGQRIDWVAGLYLTRENSAFTQDIGFYSLPTATVNGTLLTSPAAGTGHYPSRFEEAAVFGQVDYHLTPRMDVAVGGRVSYDIEQLRTTIFGGAIEGASALLPKYKNDEQPDTWSVSPRWAITDATTAYLRFSTGYRPGGPNLVPPGAPTTYHDYYQSDSTMNYEAGVRSEFFNRVATVDLAVFHIDWSNIQIRSIFVEPNGVSYGATGNGGTAESSGLEYNLGVNPLHGLSIALIGAYTDAHLTQNAPGLGAFSGQDLAYVPKWSNTLNVDYQWRIAEGYTAFIGGTAVFEGTRYTDFASSTLSDPHTKLPAYQTLALQGGIKTGAYTFEAYAKNVTDSRGVTYYSGISGYGNTGIVNLITPRVIGVRASVNY